MRRVYKKENLQSKVDGVFVRPIRQEDAADLYAIVSHPQVFRTMVFAPSIEFNETLEWVQRKNVHCHRLVAEVDGRVVGSGDLTAITRARRSHTGELGLMVHPDCWNRRVGTALMAGLLNIADNWLNLQRLELEVFEVNTAAIKLYENFGFEKECHVRHGIFGNGRFLNEFFMARLRGLETRKSSEASPSTERRAVSQENIDSLKIRPLHPNDVNDLSHLWGHPQVGRTTMQLPSQELWLSENRVENKPPGYHRFVADLDGVVIGSISLGVKQNPRMTHSAHLGMMVSPDYWGLGIGSQLMTAVLDLADNWLNLKRVELEVHTDNPPAIGLYKKFGFEIEGKKRFHTFGDGRWTDSYLMARLRDE